MQPSKDKLRYHPTANWFGSSSLEDSVLDIVACDSDDVSLTARCYVCIIAA